MYSADDALKDIKFLSPEYGSSGEQHKAYERVLDYISKQRFKEQIPEVCRPKYVKQENSAFGAYLRRER